MNGRDEIIHQSTRLRIMAALATLPRKDAIEFTRLKSIIATTDGNLGAHLETLAKAGYIAIDKQFVDRKPQTRISITAAGRRAFNDHVAYLRDIIDTTEKKL
jgi:DNA-binding MarR family transcriptional regulator